MTSTEARQIAEQLIEHDKPPYHGWDDMWNYTNPVALRNLARAYRALEARCAALEKGLRFARNEKALSVSLNRDETADELKARLTSILVWCDEVDALLTDNGGRKDD